MTPEQLATIKELALRSLCWHDPRVLAMPETEEEDRREAAFADQLQRLSTAWGLTSPAAATLDPNTKGACWCDPCCTGTHQLGQVLLRLVEELDFAG